MNFISPLTEDEKHRRRRANGEVLEDGEYASFDLAFRDSAPRSIFLTDAAAGSIDERLKAQIAESAKAARLKPTEWLAQQIDRDLKQLIERVAAAVVGEASAAGIAGAFKMDKIADAAVAVQVDRERAAHVAKFAFLGDHAPAFDEERAAFLARQQHQAGAAARNAIRDSRHQPEIAAASEAQSGSITTGTQDSRAVIGALRAARYGG